MEKTFRSKRKRSLFQMEKGNSTSKIQLNFFDEFKNTRFFIILVGIPASGKSMFAQQFKQNLINKGLNEETIKIIDTDQIREVLYGKDFNPDNEAFVITEKYKTIDQFSQESSVRFIIVDDLNYLTSQRKRLHDIAKKHQMVSFVIFFDCPLEKALLNNKKRAPNEVPEYVIRRIHSKLDIPGKKYVWDKFNYRYLCNDDFPNKSILEDIINAMIVHSQASKSNEKQTLEQIEYQEGSKNRKLDYHQIDLITRKILTEMIQNVREKCSIDDESILKEKESTAIFYEILSRYDSVQLNVIRQDFLHDLKEKNLIDSFDSEREIKQFFLDFCMNYQIFNQSNKSNQR